MRSIAFVQEYPQRFVSLELQFVSCKHKVLRPAWLNPPYPYRTKMETTSPSDKVMVSTDQDKRQHSYEENVVVIVFR
jgi:hypothetical protein